MEPFSKQKFIKLNACGSFISSTVWGGSYSFSSSMISELLPTQKLHMLLKLGDLRTSLGAEVAKVKIFLMFKSFRSTPSTGCNKSMHLSYNTHMKLAITIKKFVTIYRFMSKQHFRIHFWSKKMMQ